MFYELLGLGVAAAITENIVFCRGLEHGMYAQDKARYPKLLRVGGMATLLTTIAASCGWLGRYLADNLFGLLSWTRPAMLIAMYGFAVILLMVGMNVYHTAMNRDGGKISTRLVYGFVPLGTLFLVGNSSMSFLQSAVYGLGTGVGFLLASLLSHSLQVRLEHSDVPQVFRGMPATLLTLGIISLAVFGMLGHPLVA